jgi:hypothetical protein
VPKPLNENIEGAKSALPSPARAGFHRSATRAMADSRCHGYPRPGLAGSAGLAVGAGLVLLGIFRSPACCSKSFGVSVAAKMSACACSCIAQERFRSILSNPVHIRCAPSSNSAISTHFLHAGEAARAMAALPASPLPETLAELDGAAERGALFAEQFKRAALRGLIEPRRVRRLRYM